MKVAPSKILVAVDGSQNSMHAAKYALTLAKNNNAGVLVVNVVDLSSIFKVLSAGTKKQLTHLGIKEANKILDIVKNMAEQSGIPVKTEVLKSSTSAATAIINYSKKEGVDLLVVGAGEKSRVSKVLLGSVASKVIMYAPCPVLVVR
ncbi:MAG: universal stress protein [Thaumarchaeota archaeon]|nr:universal stress protein [Nitrososphaerota archaeon]